MWILCAERTGIVLVRLPVPAGARIGAARSGGVGTTWRRGRHGRRWCLREHATLPSDHAHARAHRRAARLRMSRRPHELSTQPQPRPHIAFDCVRAADPCDPIPIPMLETQKTSARKAAHPHDMQYRISMLPLGRLSISDGRSSSGSSCVSHSGSAASATTNAASFMGMLSFLAQLLWRRPRWLIGFIIERKVQRAHSSRRSSVLEGEPAAAACPKARLRVVCLELLRPSRAAP